LNFNAIPGKALLNLVSGKFLDNHHLTNKYREWLAKQPVAKFNGYPFELGRKIMGQFMLKPSVKMTVDKQFDNLIATAKSDNGGIKGNVWCALDTSGSMTWDGLDKSGTTAYDVCVSLGIYFSTLNEGAFHKNVIMFDNVSRVLQLRGSFTDMYQQIPRNAMGGTNFQSVIDEIVRIRKKSPNVPLEDYPTTLLVVSDMQFNPVGGNERTNYEAAMFKLREVFPQEWCENFKMVWWFCSNRWTSDFPSNMDCGGTYVVSGYDGSVISFILGGDEVNPDTGEKVTPSMEEVVTKALTQEALNFLSL
jgi:hypothetical protein